MPGALDDPCAWLREHRATWRELPPKLRRWARAYGRNHCAHFRSVAALVAAEAEPGARVLDVGAAPGHISAFLAGAGFQVTAVDLDPDRVGGVFEAFGVTAHRVDVERSPLPLADEAFDLVLLCQTLEHLRLDPTRPLVEIRRVLAPGGTAIVSVPQITPHMRWRFFRGEDLLSDPVQEQKRIRRIGHGGDARLYSRAQAERMLSHAGLELERVVPGGGLRTRGRRSLLARALSRLVPGRMQASLYFVVRKPTGAA